MNNICNSTNFCASNTISSFKQIVIEKRYTIPLESPNIENITKATGNINVVGNNIIKTAKGLSLEGYKLTGSKAIVNSVLSLEMEYIASNSMQSVHGIKYEVPFKESIVLPSQYNQFTRLIYSGILEGLTVLKLDDRTIYISATVLIAAEEN